MKSVNQARLALILVAVAIAIVWQLPYGRQILYPITLLGTLFHEMGHGLTALALGNTFSQMVLYSDGSGMAHWSGSPGRFNVALVAAGGLVGPSVAGGALLAASRSAKGAKWTLVGLAAFLALSALIWVRNPFGLAFVLLWAAVFAGASRIKSDKLVTLVVQVVGVMMCVAIFSDISYMFSDHAIVNGVANPSDSAQMAGALFLPYWFWGALVALFSVVAMAAGFRLSGRRDSKWS